ncbi:MAG: TonB-dependent receptor [Pyrinomonadaceae bacterium]
MIKPSLYFAFLFLFAVAGSAQSPTISGKITYGEGVALHDVSIQLIQAKNSVRSNDDGTYVFTNVRPGRYTILVHMEGFADASRSVTVTAGESVTADFRLQIASLAEQVTVTASGTEQSIFDSFQTVNSVGFTRIMEKGATSIGEILETETGIAKRSFGPGTARPVIRGFDGDRVLVLQDGVRAGSIGSQSGDHGEAIDPMSAERIEVVKGPASLLYGSNALGGVVNVIGNDENIAHDGIRGFASIVAGTADKQAGIAGGLEYGLDKLMVRGNLSSQRTGDYRSPIGHIPNSASRSHSGSFSGGYYAEKGWITGGYTFDIRRYGIPFAALFHDHGELGLGDRPHFDEDVDLRARRNSYRGSGGFRNLSTTLISGLQYNIDYTDYRHKEIESVDGIDEVGTIFDNKTFSYRSLFEQQKFGRLSGRFGFEGFNRSYDVNGEEQLIQGTVRHNAFSAFVLEELDLDRVKFQFGGRIESNRYAPENADLRDRNFTAFSGGAGVNFGLWNGGALIVNYSHSNRAPALEELYNHGPHIGNITFEIGNNDLDRETANGIDVSLRHQSGRFRLTGDVYYYLIDNFVFLAPQDRNLDGQIDIEDGLPVAKYSQANASYFGAELNANVTINQYIGVFASLDTVRAKLDEELIDLPRIPPSRAKIGFDLRFKNISVRPETIFVADQKKVFPLETPTAGYGIVNLSGSYTIGRQHVAHIISFNVYNVTNRLYRNHLSFIKELTPEVGRGLRVGYTIRFF